MRCKEVRRILQSMTKGDCEETFRRVSEHLSQCEGCRNLKADIQKIERRLIARKFQLDGIASRVPMDRGQLLARVAATPLTQRPRFLRAAWAGAAAFALFLAVAAAFLLSGRDGKTRHLGTPMPTRVTTGAAPSETLNELAKVLCRHEAPSPDVPYTPEAFGYEPFYPSIRQYLEPEDTLRTVAQTTINLTRRDET